MGFVIKRKNGSSKQKKEAEEMYATYDMTSQQSARHQLNSLAKMPKHLKTMHLKVSDTNLNKQRSSVASSNFIHNNNDDSIEV